MSFSNLRFSPFFLLLAVVGCSQSAPEPPTSPSGETRASATKSEPSDCPEFLGDCVKGDVPSYDERGCRIGCRTPSPCEGKACGADCTPSGSDEPFNCNATGACVSAGNALSCQEEQVDCPEFLGDCVAGDVPSYDARGCRIGCKTP